MSDKDTDDTCCNEGDTDNKWRLVMRWPSDLDLLGFMEAAAYNNLLKSFTRWGWDRGGFGVHGEEGMSALRQKPSSFYFPFSIITANASLWTSVSTRLLHPVGVRSIHWCTFPMTQFGLASGLDLLYVRTSGRELRDREGSAQQLQWIRRWRRGSSVRTSTTRLQFSHILMGRPFPEACARSATSN